MEKTLQEMTDEEIVKGVFEGKISSVGQVEMMRRLKNAMLAQQKGASFLAWVGIALAIVTAVLTGVQAYLAYKGLVAH